ncbi:MAG: hypothetical protein ACRD0J_09480 [Acidimicrobiales bacterium]
MASAQPAPTTAKASGSTPAVAQDVLAYGDATFYGSTGTTRLRRAIVGMAATPDGRGYWLVGADGGVFTYGDAHFYGSEAATGATARSMVPTQDGRGYWLATAKLALAPAVDDLTARISLATDHAAAGTPIPATLIVTNRGPKTVNLNLDDEGCRPSFALALTRQGFPPQVFFHADCSTQPFLVHPGINRFSTTVSTSYGQCTQHPSQASVLSPACIPAPELMPPLPPGHYRVVEVGLPLHWPPAAVAVALSASPVWVPAAFRSACGHPGAHVEVTKVPVTVRHAVCDLTGALITYKGYGGAYVTIQGGSIANSSGLTLTVDPHTHDLTVTVTGIPGNA